VGTRVAKVDRGRERERDREPARALSYARCVDVEVLLESASGRMARVDDIYVQVRWGILTVAALDRMLEIFRDRRWKTRRMLYALFVIEPDADVPTAEVRARQKEILAEVASGGPFIGIVVIEGQGLLAHLGRSNMATMAPETLCVDEVAEAARILARERGKDDADAIVSAVEIVRRR
jgi:hypothetical protein